MKRYRNKYEIVVSPGKAIIAAFALVTMGFTMAMLTMYGYSLYHGDPVQDVHVNPQINYPEDDIAQLHKELDAMNDGVTTVNDEVNSLEGLIRHLNDETDHRNDYTEKNYIQPAHTDVDYVLSGDTLRIEDIDRTARLNGKSMQPTMFTDNIVISTEYDDQELEEGMIVTYRREDGGTTTHRIQGDYEDTQDELVTLGDNNRYSETINVSQVEYIVKGVLFR